jgi:outer membrane protein OmpA-like peptidoglycan-associated protein
MNAKTAIPGRRSVLAAGLALSALLVTTVLAACQASGPPPERTQKKGSGFSPRQIDALREYGFEPVDDGWELQMSGKLLFDFDSDRLDGSSRTLVERIGRGLSAVGIDSLRVEGHTDDQGSDAYNERLSQRRAQAVAQVLGDAGVPIARITVQGLGRSRPLVRSGSDTGRRENRRVAIIVPAP